MSTDGSAAGTATGPVLRDGGVAIVSTLTEIGARARPLTPLASAC
jgi:hypothetical protein